MKGRGVGKNVKRALKSRFVKKLTRPWKQAAIRKSQAMAGSGAWNKIGKSIRKAGKSRFLKKMSRPWKEAALRKSQAMALSV